MFDLTPSQIISRVLILLIALPVHELAHAYTAHFFGDTTPERNGRLSLNPLVHLDPLGTIMLLIAGFGWAKPVPVNPYTLEKRSPSANLLVSLAGPMSNLALAILAALPVRFGLIRLTGSTGSFFPAPAEFILWFIIINLALMLFNLIPLFPLDGEKVVSYLLPPNLSRYMEAIRPYGSMILLGLIILGRMSSIDVIGWIMDWPLYSLFGLLTGV
ncbi:MAG: site-2 protease family protein [Anaerolinea sp.]|nr:site-2 protease family protein [Anaerolinea sp.]